VSSPLLSIVETLRHLLQPIEMLRQRFLRLSRR
jgi:hypothetical protein